MEFYVDDMIVKFENSKQHTQDLTKVFGRLREFDMRFNPEKCVFEVEEGNS